MLNVMTNEQLNKVAPSIFATQPWGGVSDKYTFIPTIQIVDEMRKEGFMPVRASQSIVRTDGKQGFAKHMIRFQQIKDIEASWSRPAGHHFYARHGECEPEIAEVVLVNSHDRASGFQLDGGIFRLACSNGLMIKSSDLGSISVRHSGNIRDNVIDGCIRIVEDMPLVMDRVTQMKRIVLDRREQELFAEAALQLRYPADESGTAVAPIEPDKLLRVRRSADDRPDLWSVFNVVQENFIKGGLRGTGSTGKRMSTRPIKSVNEDIRMNKALWLLAEGMKDIKSR